MINKLELAPLVGASLDIMDRDARRMRGQRPFVFANLRLGQGVADIAAFVERAEWADARYPRSVSRRNPITGSIDAVGRNACSTATSSIVPPALR